MPCALYINDCEARMRILLAEDEGKVASFIARALQENAYAVDVAETGEKALELGQGAAYDAILLDIGLPVCLELKCAANYGNARSKCRS